jgi:ketosteroid isomerase-like protein
MENTVNLRAVTTAAVCVALTAACAQRPAFGALEQERLQQREAAFLTALGARELERAMAHFADDAVLHVASMPPVRGRDAIQGFYENVFRFMTASAATPEVARMSSGGDMAYTMGRVTNVFQGDQGPVEYAGKYLLVWELRAGDWRIVVYSISSNQPDAARSPGSR